MNNILGEMQAVALYQKDPLRVLERWMKMLEISPEEYFKNEISLPLNGYYKLKLTVAGSKVLKEWAFRTNNHIDGRDYTKIECSIFFMLGVFGGEKGYADLNVGLIESISYVPYNGPGVINYRFSGEQR